MKAVFLCVVTILLLAASMTSSVVFAEEVEEDIDFTPLINFCKSIYKTHHPYLAYRHHNGYEKELHKKAIDLATHLEQALDASEEKDHNKFSCAQARSILGHEHAANFVTHFTKLMKGELIPHVKDDDIKEPKYTNAELIEKLELLKQELTDSNLVNEEVVLEVQDIINALTILGGIHPKIEVTYNSVIKKDTADEQCRQDYVSFIKELMEIYGDRIPKWKAMEEGIQALVHQCTVGEDKLIDINEL